MSKKYDVLVFIGRFQPFHLGHKQVIDKALTLAERVFVLIGSSNRSRDGRNPFTFDERKKMILNTYGFNSFLSNKLDFQRIHPIPLNDVMYNDETWIEQVQTLVNSEILKVINNSETVWVSGINDISIGLIGCKKDNTSYYLSLFPTWKSEPVDFFDSINATNIRDDFFEDKNDWQTAVSTETKTFLTNFKNTSSFEALRTARIWHKNYKLNVQKYPRIEHTVDSVVIQSGHVLLVRRRSDPGKGLWAMPGGFLNSNERMLDGALRELREETRLAVPEPVLRGSLITSKTYDDPNRSERGRIITQAYLFHLTANKKLPKIKGSDDADKARWVPLANLKAEDMFEDHYFIIRNLIAEL